MWLQVHVKVHCKIIFIWILLSFFSKEHLVRQRITHLPGWRLQWSIVGYPPPPLVICEFFYSFFKCNVPLHTHGWWDSMLLLSNLSIFSDSFLRYPFILAFWLTRQTVTTSKWVNFPWKFAKAQNWCTLMREGDNRAGCCQAICHFPSCKVPQVPL